MRALRGTSPACEPRPPERGRGAGNLKDYGITAIERDGPRELRGDPGIMTPLDELLRLFVAQPRMKLAGGEYMPCNRLDLVNGCRFAPI